MTKADRKKKAVEHVNNHYKLNYKILLLINIASVLGVWLLIKLADWLIGN